MILVIGITRILFSQALQDCEGVLVLCFGVDELVSVLKTIAEFLISNR